MLLALKELVIILIVSMTVFTWIQPIALQFGGSSDFTRRRNVWLSLTVAGFVAPNFTLYCLIAVPLLIWAGRREPNPPALYLLLLHVIPPIAVTLHMIGVSQLFDLNNYNLLALCVMLPTVVRLRRDRVQTQTIQHSKSMDVLLLAYGALTSVLFVLPEAYRGVIYEATISNDIRHAFIFIAFTYVPYYAISRSLISQEMLREAMMAFCVACFIMAALAVCEGLLRWLLYGDIAVRWGYGNSIGLYLMRGGSLRAMASSGHPLVLGYLLAIAFGFWLYLLSYVRSWKHRAGGTVLLGAGLLACAARGAWLSAVIIYLSYAALGPRVMSGLLRSFGLSVLGLLILSLTPLGDRIFSVLPFLGGSIDNGSYVYRQQLLERSWQIIEQSPFFGDQAALLKMQDLRQGEGIIDLINAYVGVLLDNGFIGLSLLLGFILTGLLKVIASSRQSMRRELDVSRLGISLAACIIGTLFYFLDGGMGGGVERVFYVLAGFAVAYNASVSYIAKSSPRITTLMT